MFPDHFTLDMAEAVVSEPPVSELESSTLSARLVDKSLVTTVNAPDGSRYQLLEMLRQYGHDRLIEAAKLTGSGSGCSPGRCQASSNSSW